MTLLLTSGGVTNPSIRDALAGLPGKPIADSSALWIGDDFVSWTPPDGSDSTLGVVGFSIFPRLGHKLMPGNTLAEAERWAAGIAGPAYAIADQTAIKVAQ